MKTVKFLGEGDIYMCQCVGPSENCPEDHSGTYVLASEAKAEVDNANADWIERCRKFRAQDAEEANERIKVLEVENDKLSEVKG